jgi:predicted AAA+ superfamily ATPase
MNGIFNRPKNLPWKIAMFKRIIDLHLAKWKEDPFRKPLLLRGARQVGKTYAIRKLGGLFKSFVEVNFERLEGASSIFEKEKRKIAQRK